MAEISSARSNTFYLVAANLIVVIGLLAFTYVGEQVSRGNRDSPISLMAPQTISSPVGAARFVE